MGLLGAKETKTFLHKKFANDAICQIRDNSRG